MDTDQVSFSLLQALGISIFSGVLTVALIGVIKFIYSKGINDIIQSGIKRNIKNIEGIWEASGTHKNHNNTQYNYTDRTTIRQIGRTISGDSIYTTITNGQQEIKKFTINGTIQNDVVAGTYENNSDRSVGIGSFTMVINQGGKSLKGYYAIYDVDLRNVECWPYELTLKDSNL
jgi:hypothetical protein